MKPANHSKSPNPELGWYVILYFSIAKQVVVNEQAEYLDKFASILT